MRVLALDVGEKRIGIAKPDETGTLAVPHSVYCRKNLAEDVASLATLCQELRIEALVVGLPLNMDGTEGPQAKKVREFAEKLAEVVKVPVFYVDERWTTKEAERAMREAGEQPSREKEKVDALSAVLILQAWLESRRSGYH
jgi:putative Holliday junction resolvase